MPYNKYIANSSMNSYKNLELRVSLFHVLRYKLRLVFASSGRELSNLIIERRRQRKRKQSRISSGCTFVQNASHNSVILQHL
jgi:hypothetical protein